MSIVRKYQESDHLPLPLLSSFACITSVIPRGLPTFCSCFRTIFSQHKCRFFIMSLQNLQCLRFYQESSSLYIKFLHDLTPVTSLTRSPNTTLYSLLIASQPLWPHFFQIGQTCFCLSAFLQGPFPLPGMLWISAKQCHPNEVYFHLSIKEQKPDNSFTLLYFPKHLLTYVP